MDIKLTKTRSGRCRISTWANKVTIYCEQNDGEITVMPRYKKQVYDIIKLIRNNRADGFENYGGVTSIGRKFYNLASMYRRNYPDRILRFYSNNILEEDFDNIIELLQGVEVEDKVRLNKKDLCNYNLLQLKTILTSMKRRKKINGEKDNYFINIEV